MITIICSQGVLFMIVYCSINSTAAEKNITQTQLDSLQDFCRSWTDQIEIETSYARYCNLPKHFSAAEFGMSFITCLKTHHLSGIWGAGTSKLLAKLVASIRPNTVLLPEDNQKFLADLPLNLLPISETPTLNKLGIYTIRELAGISSKALTLQFGSKAAVLVKLAQGEDVKPFTPVNSINIFWEKNFLTDPNIATMVSRPQLDLFLKKGLADIEHQLKSAKLKTTKIELNWKAASQSFKVVKKFHSGTCQAQVLIGCLINFLPNYPIESLKIIGLSFNPLLPKQLDIFGENPTYQKIDFLKSRLSNVLITLNLTRREKILSLWEQAHL